MDPDNSDSGGDVWDAWGTAAGPVETSADASSAFPTHDWTTETFGNSGSLFDD